MERLPIEIQEYIIDYVREEIYESLEDRFLKDFIEREYRTENGGKTFLFGKIHSFRDSPAITTPRSKHWYKLGKLHRKGNPAYIRGTLRIWAIEGVIGREGGLPCVEDIDRLEWRKNGKLHRKILPAVITREGYHWYIDGKPHGSPSIYYPNKYIAEHINGKKISETILDPTFSISNLGKLII